MDQVGSAEPPILTHNIVIAIQTLQELPLSTFLSAVIFANGYIGDRLISDSLTGIAVFVAH